jgi:hypothetical protein
MDPPVLPEFDFQRHPAIFPPRASNLTPYPHLRPLEIFGATPLPCKLRQDSTLIVDNNLHISFAPTTQNASISYAVLRPFVNDHVYRIRARLPDAQTSGAPTPVSHFSPGASSNVHHEVDTQKPPESPTPTTEPRLFIQMKGGPSIRLNLSKMLTETSE